MTRATRGRRRDDSREAKRKTSRSPESSAPRRSNQKRARSDSREESPRRKSSRNRGVSKSPKKDDRGREKSTARSASKEASPQRREGAGKEKSRKAEEQGEAKAPAPSEPPPPEPPEFVDPRVNMDGCAENFVEEIDISQLPDGTLLEDFMMLEDGTMLADANFFGDEAVAGEQDAYDPEAVPHDTHDYWKRTQEEAPQIRVTEEALALALTEQSATDDPDSHGHCTVGKWTTVALKSIKDHDARLRPEENQLELVKKSQGNSEDDQWKSLVRWNSRSRSREDDKDKDKQAKAQVTEIQPVEDKEKEKEKEKARSSRYPERASSKPRRSGERHRSRGRRSRSRRRRQRSGSRHKRAKRTSFNFGENANAEAAATQISAKLSGFGRQSGGGFDQQLAQIQPENSRSGFGRTEIKLTQVQIRCLLGKGGACVQSIMRQTGAQIVVRTPPSSHLGIVTISGNHKPAMQAIEQVLIQKGCPIDTITAEGISVGPGVVEVPERLVGRLVGKTSFFATVQDQLGEDTVIQKLPHMSPSGGRYVQIAGEHWMQAKQMVIAWVEGQKTRPQAGLPPLMGGGMMGGMPPGATPRPGMTPGMASGVATPMMSGFATPMPGTMTPSGTGISL
mmetsp:Transcript_128177/g.235788  ORF Transcript_128177/g.235788 Transcript_128177/m.235788 type:complete len:621 (+) Transcript_128177:156-2018(+)